MALLLSVRFGVFVNLDPKAHDLRGGFRALHSLHNLGVALIETSAWWKVQMTTGVNQREAGAHQPGTGLFYLFSFIAQIPRPLGSSYH